MPDKIKPMKLKGFASMGKKKPSPKKTNMDYGKLPQMNEGAMKPTEAVETTAINLGEEGMFTKSGAFNIGLAMGRKNKANEGKRISNRAGRQSKRGDRQEARGKKRAARKANKKIKF